jgi:hypothetical protein
LKKPVKLPDEDTCLALTKPKHTMEGITVENMLSLAIDTNRMDLAAHVLVLAALQVLASQRITNRANIPAIRGDTMGGQTNEIAKIEPEKPETGILL